MKLVYIKPFNMPFGNMDARERKGRKVVFIDECTPSFADRLKQGKYDTIYWSVEHRRMTLWVGKTNRDGWWLVEGPDKIGDLTKEETAQALADMCMLRYELKEKEE